MPEGKMEISDAAEEFLAESKAEWDMYIKYFKDNNMVDDRPDPEYPYTEELMNELMNESLRIQGQNACPSSPRVIPSNGNMSPSQPLPRVAQVQAKPVLGCSSPCPGSPRQSAVRVGPAVGARMSLPSSFSPTLSPRQSLGGRTASPPVSPRQSLKGTAFTFDPHPRHAGVASWAPAMEKAPAMENPVLKGSLWWHRDAQALEEALSEAFDPQSYRLEKPQTLQDMCRAAGPDTGLLFNESKSQHKSLTPPVKSSLGPPSTQAECQRKVSAPSRCNDIKRRQPVQQSSSSREYRAPSPTRRRLASDARKSSNPGTQPPRPVEPRQRIESAIVTTIGSKTPRAVDPRFRI